MSDLDFNSTLRHIADFEVLRELGRGGSARVFLVRDTQNVVRGPHPQGIYALKAIPNDAEDRNKFLVRFHQEFNTVKRLDHTHIIQTYLASATPEFVFFVMEYVGGGTLRDVLHRQPGRPIPVTDAVDCAVQMALALEHAHKHGIIHRDVKPSNILLREHNEQPYRFVLTDFGTAKVIGERGVTKSGMTIGTPEYMSPEQAEGREDIDGRTDIYALGCVLFEMLAGRPPFDGPSALSILFRQVHASVPVLRGFNKEVPPGLVSVVERMLAKHPDDRYQRAEDVVDHLNPFLGNRENADLRTNPLMPQDLPSAQGGSASRPITSSRLDEPTLQSITPVSHDVFNQPEPEPSVFASVPRGVPDGAPMDVSEIATQTPQVDERGVVRGPSPLAPAAQQPSALQPQPQRGPAAPNGLLSPLPQGQGGGLPANGPGGAHVPGVVRPGPRPTRRLPPDSILPAHDLGQSGSLPPALKPPPGMGQGVPNSQPNPGLRPPRLSRPAGSSGGYAPNPLVAPADAQRAHIEQEETARSWSVPGAPRARRRPRGSFVFMIIAVLVLIAGVGTVAFLASSAPESSTPPATQHTPTSTNTTAPTATATAPTATTVSSTNSPADVQAAAAFRAITVGTGKDLNCSSANQTAFASGGPVYVNICTSQSMPSAPTTITLDQNGQPILDFVTNKYLPAGTYYDYYIQRNLAPGNYTIVVTMQINGQTGTAKTIPITVQ